MLVSVYAARDTDAMPVDAPKPAAQKPKRRWSQFGLRSLLGLVTLAGIGMMLIVVPAQRQKWAVAVVRDLGGSASYEGEVGVGPVPKRSWYRKLLGDDYFSSVIQIYLRNTKVTDAGVAQLKDLPRLKSLDLRDTQATDAGFAPLKGLIRLESLDLRGTRVTDAVLAHMQELTQLKWLDLSGTQVTDAGLTHLKGLTRLELLALDNSRISDTGLEHLKGLTAIETLHLNGTQLTDAGLKHLKRLTRLKLLVLDNTQVTRAGAADLRLALPACAIFAP